MDIHQIMWITGSLWTKHHVHSSSQRLFRNKAISDAAISFYLDHLVSTRVSKFTYGSFIHIAYASSNPDHQYRSRNAFTSVPRARRVRGSFSIILPKVSCCSLSSRAWVCYLKTIICRVPKFRRRRISEVLLLGNRLCGWFTSSYCFCLVLPWKRPHNHIFRVHRLLHRLS